eukprot:207099-Hanusia_phi.AAC.1
MVSYCSRKRVRAHHLAAAVLRLRSSPITQSRGGFPVTGWQVVGLRDSGPDLRASPLLSNQGQGQAASEFLEAVTEYRAWPRVPALTRAVAGL